MVDPPVDDGTANAMLAVLLPAVAMTLVGVPGTVLLGVTGVIVVSPRGHANRAAINTHDRKRLWRGERTEVWSIGSAKGDHTFREAHASIIASPTHF